MYLSTKTYGHEVGLSACFRQWRAQSHCNQLHGYALSIKFVFQAKTLDVRNWVVDFGGLKPLKAMLEDTFDHKLLVAEDDPLLETFRMLENLGGATIVVVPACGCEMFAELVYNCAEQWLKDAGYGDRVKLVSAEVREHGANSAMYIPMETV